MTAQEILIKAGQLVLSLSILVIFHELGHFIPARLFKIKVEKFYLFFDPWFSLFKFKKGDTEYGIGWLPLGGYVKISGMIDESMDKEQMAQPPQPWEFRSKPAWQRLIVMIGGVSVNIILAFFIYAMLLWHFGQDYLPYDKVTYGIQTDSLSRSIGLRDGDQIVTIDNKVVDKFNKMSSYIILHQAKSIQVKRDGETLNIRVPDTFVGNVIANKDPFLEARVPFVVKAFSDSGHAKQAGVKVGDEVVSLNGHPIHFHTELVDSLQAFKGNVAQVGMLRGNDTLQFSVPLTNGKMGIYAADYDDSLQMRHFTMVHKSYGFFESLPAGVQQVGESLHNYVLQLKLIFVAKGVKTSESVGGFVTIGSLFPAIWDWQSFWMLTAFLSIILAFMNILPIPALDGGHVLFLLYEVVTGRKPGEKFLEYAQYVGMVILLGLLVFANGNDLWRHVFSKWFQH
ncbi:site-2 protease. Metallo peptidase. MEROPS family M50B [Chitinophaga costaii]|uniref:Zinc metalloprotease n=1 Tax=Chitinophaga costaii TaxID=1335309 RepID=A0A1C3Z3C8_9BACT|nr:RIP metalloprotease RseP [Chitinophaga costaii]PUZ30216.1 RIP metalloprotease RseP [Chitinophaga costaii]SCB76917.1 site-2 protease. Metallo peptidase. MEROPS family M50B [Chitinophaga costaii]